MLFAFYVYAGGAELILIVVTKNFATSTDMLYIMAFKNLTFQINDAQAIASSYLTIG